MPRKGEVPKREIVTDPKYTEHPEDVRRRITKFINFVMDSGKKSVAEKIVYGAFDKVADRAKEDPIKIFERAMSNVKPKLEVKSVVSAGQRTRFRLMFGASVRRRWECVGWYRIRGRVVKKQW